MTTLDYELSDRSCPKCKHRPTHSRRCTAMYCEDGYIDEYESDAINFAPNEEYLTCEECNGTGIECWCPKCGADLNRIGAGAEGVVAVQSSNFEEAIASRQEFAMTTFDRLCTLWSKADLGIATADELAEIQAIQSVEEPGILAAGALADAGLLQPPPDQVTAEPPDCK